MRFFVKSEVPETELIVSQLWDRGTTGIYEAESGEVIAGFDSEAEADRIASWLRAADDVTSATVTVEPAATGSEWAINTEPVTHRITSDRHDFSITITAEATFGHGDHPTTRLAIDLLLASLQPGMRVLDLGTGSGVLAIAAAKAGAGRVTAIDIDPDAVLVATGNAEANGVAIDCSTSTVSDLMAHGSPGFDLVVMNVLLPVHRALASDVIDALAPGGLLITSGFLQDQRSEIAALYTAGERLLNLDSVTTDDWSATVFAVKDQR